MKLILLFLLVALINVFGFAATPLEKCWNKQVRPSLNKHVHGQFEEVVNKFSHSMEPWQQHKYSIAGTIWFNSTALHKFDTLTTESSKEYNSTVDYSKDVLLFKDYGDNDLYEVTEYMVRQQLLKACRYSPIMLLDYFYKNSVEESQASASSSHIYLAEFHEYNFQLFIDKATLLVSKISVTYDVENDDEDYGFGDVKDVFTYEDYLSIENNHIPKRINIIKLNGKLTDRVLLKNPAIVEPIESILKNPDGYQIKADKVVEPDVSVEQYSENITLINLHHCGTRSLMVEFSDFVFVAEAPLNSKNGAMLINEVKKIAGDKPIKYFAFGHFHPHYTGGIRPFIHAGAKIVCVKEDQEYIEFIANASHSINPDLLQLENKGIDFEFVTNAKTINDGSYDMTIYHIGSQSNHTQDYLIYYFPEERMIFQDDLVWINKTSTKENLSATTKGFYDAVKSRGLEVTEVVQNWSVFDKSKTMIFQFADIEKLMNE